MDKVIIIGGLGDLGYNLTSKLLNNNYELVITTKNITSFQIKKVESHLLTKKISLLELDLQSEESIDRFISDLSIIGSEYNGLVITAGVPYGNLIQMTSKEDLSSVFNQNLFSIVHLLNKIVRIARRSVKSSGKEFSIVIYSSMYSFYNDHGSFAYGASKSALNYLIKSMSIEMAKNRIRVNGVAPTVVENPMGNMMSDISKENLLKFTNSKNPIESNKVSNVVKFLLSDDSKGINGQIIKIT